jgi:uncharacterized integral membrane protein
MIVLWLWSVHTTTMLSLIVLLIFGSAVAYLATQNTTPVVLNFLHYSLPSVPLYYVILGSIMLGVLLAYVIHMINVISMAFTLHNKNKIIMASEKELSEITKKAHVLELENAELQKDADPDSIDKKSM